MSNNILFDRTRLAQRRQRAERSARSAWFLHDLACDQLKEKLMDINRDFRRVAIIGPRAQVWASELGLKATLLPDEDILDFGDGDFDLIIHAMALHWSNDPVGQLIQMRRALQPDGVMMAATFGGDTLFELREMLLAGESRIRGGAGARIAPQAEIRTLGNLLQRAGFRLPVADNLAQVVSYSDLISLMRDLREMGETNVLAEQPNTGLNRAILAETEALYRKTHALDDGNLKATFEIIFLTGWAMHETQQKPLQPGSAEISLSQALKNLQEET